MRASRSRQFFTLLLVIGAMAFGMVLAGGLEMTPVAQSGPATVATTATNQATGTVAFPDFADLAAAVDPAVVSIRATKFEDASQAPRGGSPFEFFFGPRQRGPRQPTPQPDNNEPFRSDSGGSGFVVSEDGLIVTNNHVIRGATQIDVVLGDREYRAEIRGTDPSTDIALLKIDAGRPLTYLRLGDSETLRVGEWVIAVGSPLDLRHTVTVGVVSGKGRALGISDFSFENFIQTDAAINFGNSGGPLLNIRGEVVGINTAINYDAENIGFAVPINTLKTILPQLRDSGRVRRGYLGLSVRNVDWEIAQAYGLQAAEGALVAVAVPGKPGDKAGVKAEDVILKVDNRPVKTTRDLIDYVSAKGPNASVELEIWRNGKKLRLDVKLDEREPGDEEEAEPAEEESKGIEWLGLRYQNLTPQLRSSHQLPDTVEGVWITSVATTSPIYDDFPRGSGLILLLTAVNGEPVTTAEDLERAVKKAASGSRLRLYVRTFVNGEEGGPVLVFPIVP
ncbi:MAG TPA: trypsin-like peptidase domain-containing protein [Thermoanaerobaculia bacterium]|nr:trypsin-like peptidase domain-containing protein [Thermoanaerobaculia bacterium]